MATVAAPVILGIVEGVTEFIPVSSTGHLILTESLIGYTGPQARLLDILIQLGAILAICWNYRSTLWQLASNWPTDAKSRQFILKVGVATVPAAVVGAFAHDFIEETLFSPWVVATSLVLGGVAILIIEHARSGLRSGKAAVSLTTALGIGMCQVLSMIPGVSRSGSTIMGAVALGVERRKATEFSFFLAIPTMFGAAALDLAENRSHLGPDDLAAIGMGLVVSFLVALVMVRWLIAFVGRHGFSIFAWYRIAAGTAALIVLAIMPHDRPPLRSVASIVRPNASWKIPPPSPVPSAGSAHRSGVWS